MNFGLCRRAGGRFLLRIEDIDPVRSRPEFEAAIREDLTWLGLTWEEPVRRQSDHLDDYRAAAARLRGLLYPAFLSRREIAQLTADPAWPRDPDGAPHYPSCDRMLDPAEAARRVAAGEPHALRLDMARAISTVPGDLAWQETGPAGETGPIRADPAAWGDVMLVRRDTPTSYHLAVSVDDALQGVTHVVRGADLFHATSIHVLLQALLELPTPVYHHHRLIHDAEGRKLSKRFRDTSIRDLRASGATPADIRAMVGLADDVSA